MTFVKIPVIVQSKENDAIVHIRTDKIIGVGEASTMDRKVRGEINAIVELEHGGRYGTSYNAATVLEKIKEAEMST